MNMNRLVEMAENRFAENEKRHKMNYKVNVELRRNTVQSLIIRGQTQWEIAEYLGVSQPTVSRDIQWLKAVAKKELKVAVEKKIPEEYHRYMVGLDEVLRNAWDIALSGDVDKTRLDALNFVLQCSKQRMDAIMNPPVLTKSNSPVKRFNGNSYLEKNHPKVSNNNLTVKKKEINKTQNPQTVGDFITTKNNG
jgi:predicted transcriptional regulator